MHPFKLYMLLLGASPKGRHTEQHDIFFSIGQNLAELVPAILKFWPEAKQVHIDAWREVTRVDGHNVEVVDKNKATTLPSGRLFFLNLGGYKQNEFEEFHYRMLVAAGDKGEAIRKAKQTSFYKHTGFKGSTSHIDDKFGVDVDDIFEIADILPAEIKERYAIELTPAPDEGTDEIHLGYFKLDKLPG